MLRFPNPGSDISAFVRTFQALFGALRTLSSFSLDDMSRALVSKNLATSSGRIGQEALKRSTRPNRSLDPLFNQSKMYSELFRILGWIHPLSTSKQKLVFSFLGIHIGSAQNEPTQLVKECLLGIAYPNPLVVVKGSNSVRPATLIISTAAALDGRITRDEIILGPLDIDDDRRVELVAEMVKRLRLLRRNPTAVEEALREKAAQLRIQVNTLHNYTRFPLGILRWAGWTRPERDNGLFDVLANEGIRMADWIKTLHDVRARDLTDFSTDEIDSFLKVATYRMFERAGYDVATQGLEDHERRCRHILTTLGIEDTKQILFSPFQEYDPQRIETVFPALRGDDTSDMSQVTSAVRPTGRPEQEVRSYVRLQAANRKMVSDEPQSDIISRISYYAKSKGPELDEIVKAVTSEYIGSSKDRFYPAVEALFRYLGYQCELSRVGVNYQRMDALIKHTTQSIPIEIKSPGEEEFISVKGIRQALENKIVLMARKYAPSQWQTTSLVVGFELPADRSEVSNLVEDIYVTYDISVGVIDFHSLVRLAALRLLQERKPKDEDLFGLRGLIQIGDS